MHRSGNRSQILSAPAKLSALPVQRLGGSHEVTDTDVSTNPPEASGTFPLTYHFFLGQPSLYLLTSHQRLALNGPNLPHPKDTIPGLACLLMTPLCRDWGHGPSGPDQLPGGRDNHSDGPVLPTGPSIVPFLLCIQGKTLTHNN